MCEAHGIKYEWGKVHMFHEENRKIIQRLAIDNTSRYGLDCIALNNQEFLDLGLCLQLAHCE